MPRKMQVAGGGMLDGIRNFFQICRGSTGDASQPPARTQRQPDACIRVQCSRGAEGSFGCYLDPTKTALIYDMIIDNIACIRFSNITTPVDAYIRELKNNGTGMKILHSPTDKAMQDEVNGERVAREAFGDDIEKYTTYPLDASFFRIEPTCDTLKLHMGRSADQVMSVKPFMFVIPALPCKSDFLTLLQPNKLTSIPSDWLKQVVCAVRRLHEHGFHRDIKLENIALCDDGTVKLLDFGLSCSRTTDYDHAKGTPRYLYELFKYTKNYAADEFDDEIVNRKLLEPALRETFNENTYEIRILNDIYAIGVVYMVVNFMLVNSMVVDRDYKLVTRVSYLTVFKDIMQIYDTCLGADGTERVDDDTASLVSHLPPTRSGGGKTAGQRWVSTGRKTKAAGGRARLLWRNAATGELRTRRMVLRGDGKRVAAYVKVARR